MCTKECILIIDRNTGEAILERISDTVQLKAIRSDKGRLKKYPLFVYGHDDCWFGWNDAAGS